MDIALLIVRLLLAAVFTVAGLAKLVDRGGSRQAMVDFGLPMALAGPLGMLLPVAELAIAVALLPVSTAWWGAVGATVLLILFVAGISVNLLRGRKPDCHCFGQLYSAPAGWPTLVRNGVLAAMAGFVVWQGQFDPGSSAVSWLGSLRAAEIVGLVGGVILVGLLGLGSWLLVNLIRQNGRLLVRMEALEARLTEGGTAVPSAEVPTEPEKGLPLGAPAPAFSLSGLYGEMLTLDFLRAAGTPVMLIFSDPGCGPCNALLPEIGRWQGDYAANMTFALISRGTPEANRAKSTQHGLRRVLLQQDREVAEAYQVAATPSAVIVRPDGTIGSPLAVGAEAIRTLVTRTAGTAGPIPKAAPAAMVAEQDGDRNGVIPPRCRPGRLASRHLR